MRRSVLRVLRPRPWLPRLLLGTLCTLSFLAGVLVHRYAAFMVGETARDHDSNSFLRAKLPPRVLPQDLPKLALLTPGFAGYTSVRRAEYRAALQRNALLPRAVAERVVVACELLPGSSDKDRTNANMTECGAATTVAGDDNNGPGTVRGRIQKVQLGGTGSYDAMFSAANALSGNGTEVVVLSHADIVFGMSLACGRLVGPGTVLALSRHPLPGCPAASAAGDTGWEAWNLCGGYDEQRGASHDVFVFRPPVPESVLADVRALRTNSFGAENVVIGAFQRAGWRVVNPCKRIHAFHLHCSLERATWARQRAGAEGRRRGLFGATARHGWVDGTEWMDKRMVEKLGSVDCEAFGRQLAWDETEAMVSFTTE